MKRSALLSLLLIAPALADRPPDWLRLPGTDPRPAGASAWILESSESEREQGDGSILRRTRFAVMPLTDAGAKHVVTVLPFIAGSSKVVHSTAWAMSADGKKCREFGGTDFAVVSPSINNLIWDQSKAITFDARRFMQPGWIFACEVEIRSDSSPFDIHWNPRSLLPIRHASLLLVPVAGGSVKWKGPREVGLPVAGADGSLAWTLDDIAPLDVNVPPSIHFEGRELRAYMLEGPAQSKSWADIVRLARAEMDPKAIATPALAQMARRAAGPGDLWARIEPVCRFVQKEVTYLEVTIDTDSMAGYRPHSAAEVCETRYGDCKDKATLLCTMLRTLGVEAYVMLVNSGEPTVNRPEWPSAMFNHAIVAIRCGDEPPRPAVTVRSDGRDYLLFDPTNDHVPLGLLPPSDAGGLGLILAPETDAPVLVPLPPPGTVTVSAQVKALVAGDGSAAFEVAEERFGYAAAEEIFRDESLPQAERAGALELRIQRRLPLASDIAWKNSDDEAARTWSTKVHFSAQYVGKRIHAGMFIPTDLMSIVPFAAPWDAESGGWVSVAPGTRIREVEIDAPAGWLVSEVPADWTIKLGAGEGSIHYENEGAVAKGRMSLTVNGGILDRAAYLEYRRLLVAALEAERSPVVLGRPRPSPVPSAPAPASH